MFTLYSAGRTEPRPGPSLLCAAALLLTAGGASAAQLIGGRWQLHYRFDGAAAGDQLGRAVSSAGDVNGDGHPDFIAGAPDAQGNGFPLAGAAFVYSGLDGSLLYRFDGHNERDHFGHAVAGGGDLNKDGFDDLVIGAWGADPNGLTDAGSVYAYSGADGSLLYQWDGAAPSDWFGWAVGCVADIGGDGYAELLVGIPRDDLGGALADDYGAVNLYTGRTGLLVMRFTGSQLQEQLGTALAGAGDANNDGFPDCLMGAPGASPGGLTGAGSAYLLSGASGALLRRFDGLAAGDGLGRSVAGVGDVDRDGFDDQLCGAPWTDPAGLPDAGSVYLYSGFDGTLLFELHGVQSAEYLGIATSGAGDVDLDGYPDFLVGADHFDALGLTDTGIAYLYSGRNGRRMQRFPGNQTNQEMGASLAGAGDVNLDGAAEVLLGSPRRGSLGLSYHGSLYVVGLASFLNLDSPTLSVSSTTPVQALVDFPPGEAGLRYSLLASSRLGATALGSLVIPLQTDPLLTKLLGGFNPGFVQGLHGVLDASGDATVLISPGPTFGSQIGRVFFLAAVSHLTPTTGPRLSSIARRLELVP